MNYRLFAALALTGLAATSPAMAQNFNGPSIGAQGGWVQNDLRNPKTDLGVVPIEAKRDSGTLGAFAAYDREFDHFVLGGEVGAQFGTSDRVNGSSGTRRLQIDPRRSFDASLRGGYLVDRKTLVYVRGGYTNDRVRTTIATPSSTIAASENKGGWLAGAGVERVIVPHISARVEYRYADLSGGDGKYDRHQMLTGIAWRF